MLFQKHKTYSIDALGLKIKVCINKKIYLPTKVLKILKFARFLLKFQDKISSLECVINANFQKKVMQK